MFGPCSASRWSHLLRQLTPGGVYQPAPCATQIVDEMETGNNAKHMCACRRAAQGGAVFYKRKASAGRISPSLVDARVPAGHPLERVNTSRSVRPPWLTLAEV